MVILLYHDLNYSWILNSNLNKFTLNISCVLQYQRNKKYITIFIAKICILYTKVKYQNKTF